MITWPILSVVTFLPVVGALIIYISRGDDEAVLRHLSTGPNASTDTTGRSP